MVSKKRKSKHTFITFTPITYILYMKKSSMNPKTNKEEEKIIHRNYGVIKPRSFFKLILTPISQSKKLVRILIFKKKLNLALLFFVFFLALISEHFPCWFCKINS